VVRRSFRDVCGVFMVFIGCVVDAVLLCCSSCSSFYFCADIFFFLL